MAETQGLLGTSRSDQAGPVEEVLSETDELAGLSLMSMFGCGITPRPS